MGKIKRKLKTLITTPNIFAKKFVGSPLFNLCSDKIALKILYKSVFNRKLDLKNPKTFNEKLQWLKLYNRKPEYTMMVDKYKVKDYIANTIGKEYVIPTLGVWDKAEDIDFETLPDQFVLKCNHGSGDVIICKDKNCFDINLAKKKLNKALKVNFYKKSREWPYKNVPRKIIAEQYIEDSTGALNDYKFFCFNGEVKCCLVVTNRFEKGKICMTFYNKEWEKLPFTIGYPIEKEGVEKPTTYYEMLRVAEILSQGQPFTRIDLYSVNNRVYFGEITFFSAGGFKKFDPEEWDGVLGKWIDLPQQGERR